MPRSSLLALLAFVSVAAGTNTLLSFTESGNTCSFEVSDPACVSLVLPH